MKTFALVTCLHTCKQTKNVTPYIRKVLLELVIMSANYIKIIRIRQSLLSKGHLKSEFSKKDVVF